MIRSLFNFCACRFLPALVVLLALIVGWLASSDYPEGRFFATIIPLMKGIPPPSIIGHGMMSGTPPVPDEFTPQPRPEGETFVELRGSGDKMPQEGIGMCCRPAAYDDVLVKNTVLWHLLQGGRHIDTASMYLNHRAIGEGIKEAIKRGIPRSEIFVVTKVNPREYGRNSSEAAVQRFLDELGLEYLDMILMHLPISFPYMTNECTSAGFNNTQCRHETWAGLSAAREKGLVRNLGVSNFNVKQLQDLEEFGGAPISNHQMMYNPWAPEHVNRAFDFCREKGIAVTAYNSLGGIMEFAMATTAATLKRIAAAKKVSVTSVLLRWMTQKGGIVIPGSGNPKHIRENINIYSFALDEKEMKELDDLAHDESAKKFFYADEGTFDWA